MTHVDAHQPCGPAHPSGPGPAPVSSALAWGLHLLVVTLLVIAAGRSVVDRGPGWPWVVVGASSVGVVYAIGTRMPVGPSAPSVRWWLALLLATWGCSWP